MGQFTDRAAVGLLSLAALVAPGCVKATTAEDVREVQGVGMLWNDIGEGVYTFDMNVWPEALVQFKEEHPNLIITAIYADKESSGNGATSSVVVNTEPLSVIKECK